MMRRAMAWAVLALLGGLLGCALFQPAGSLIYKDDSLIVRLEPNPGGDGQAQAQKAAQAVTAQQLSASLRGLYVRRKVGLLQSIIDTPSEPAFNEDELTLVARELLHGLQLASGQERVAFRLFRTGAKGVREETDGAVFMRGDLLYVTLTKFRYSSRVSYKDSESAGGFDFELFYEPTDAVVPVQKGVVARWLGSDQPSIVVDTRRFRDDIAPTLPSAASEPPVATPSDVRPPSSQAQAAPPTMDSDMVRKLQQQVKELTDANQDLQATLKVLQKELTQLQQSAQHAGAAADDLTRLRQELAETKQLMADKVLELNRLKGKPTP
jgi:hypothetical protein